MRLERKMIFLNTAFLAALGLRFAIKASFPGHAFAAVQELASARMLGVMLGGAGIALWFLRRLDRPVDSQRLAIGWLVVHLYSLPFSGGVVKAFLDLQARSGKPQPLGLWAVVLVHFALLYGSCVALFWRKGAEVQRTLKILVGAEATVATLMGFGALVAAGPLSSPLSSGVMISLLGIELAGLALALMLLGNPADNGDRRRLSLGLGIGEALTAVAAFGLSFRGLESAWAWGIGLTSAALAAGSIWAGLRPEVARRPPTGKAWASRLTWSHLLAGLSAASLVLAAPSLSIPAWAALLLAVFLAAGIGSTFIGDLQRILLDPIGLATLGRFSSSEEDETGRVIWLRQVSEAAAQEERNRLARDLHDSIKQQLFSINVGTATAQERWERDPEGARKALADVRRSAREALVEMQAMLHQLRPEALGTAGLIEALREQCEALGYRTGAEVALDLGDPIPDENLPPGAQETLFRIAQEMLANVARHARAQKVRLWLGRQGEEVVIRIQDDGQGFDPAAASGMGLRNLQERAASLHGTLEVASAPGGGAGLTVRIPLVSPPLPAVPDGKRVALVDFLNMAWHACLFVLILTAHTIVVADASGVAGKLQIAGLLLVGLLALSSIKIWFSLPRAFRSFTNRKAELLGCLLGGWWWGAGLARDPKTLTEIPGIWLLPLACFLYAAIDLAWIRRISETRPAWWKGPLSPLWLILPVEVAILLALGWTFLRSGTLAVDQLSATEAFFLLAMATAFPYVASRQRRAEGAP
jgi:signal transduction histidine kinase